jgi:predicted Zn-ribbon and HTH transcriptional regulator
MTDVGEIVRAVGGEYLATHATTPFHRKALRAIGRCRTEEMGCLPAACESCGLEFPLLRSCRNRHCPQCQAQARAEWLEERENELLPVPYFHVVFTVPAMLNDIALHCPEVFYAALLRAAGNALLDVGWSKLESRLGCLTILHTWGQNLSLHPHVHCVVPGGGFSGDGRRWVALRNPTYLLPIKVLARRFRTLLCQALRLAERNGELHRLPAEVLPHITIEGAAAQEWIAYAKRPFGGPQQVLAYLSQYTHRVAISNHRIVAFENQKVTFRWRDYADENRAKLCTLDALEFVRRFLLHVLPDRFVRIRYFGFLANRNRSGNIKRARALIGCAVPLQFAARHEPLRLCPTCRGRATVNASNPLQHHRSPPIRFNAA